MGNRTPYIAHCIKVLFSIPASQQYLHLPYLSLITDKWSDALPGLIAWQELRITA